MVTLIRFILWFLIIGLAISLSFAKKAEGELKEVIEVEVEVAPVKENIREYAERRVLEEFGVGHWKAFDTIIVKESRWRVFNAHYPSGYTKTGIKSSAYGLCGFLDQTWKDMGYKKTADPYTQVSACLDYIKARYKNPNKALQFHLKHNYY